MTRPMRKTIEKDNEPRFGNNQRPGRFVETRWMRPGVKLKPQTRRPVRPYHEQP